MIDNQSQNSQGWVTMGKVEKIITGILFLIVLGAFQHASYLNYFVSQLDAAYMVNNIDTIYTEGAPRSQMNKSVFEALDTVVASEAEAVCKLPLIADNKASQDTLERHAYMSLYLISPLRAFFSGQSIAAFIHALSFVGLVFAVYIFLRRRQEPVIWALAFVFLVVAHQAWSASVFGQFYSDRLFLPVGFLYVVLIHSRLTREVDYSGYILCLAVLAISIHERAALMVAGITFMSLFLYRGWKGWCKKDMLLLGIAICALLYAVVYMRYFQPASDYASFSSQALSFFYNIENNEAFRLSLEKFIVINCTLLLFAVFEWRMALIALVIMLPNIMGSIGGAEKIGWSTHYHSMYFPVLVAAASLGFIRLLNMLQVYRYKWIVLSVPLAMGFMLLMLDPYSLSPVMKFNSSNMKQNAVPKTVGVIRDTGTGAAVVFWAGFNKRLAAEIPEGAVVSTYEGMMPALYARHDIIHYFPLGLANADYLILNYKTLDSGEMQFYGATSYLGKENLDALNICLHRRIQEAGYMIKKKIPTVPSGNAGVVILQRT